MLKVLSQPLRGTLTTAFERHLTVFYGHGSCHVRKIIIVSRKLSCTQESEPAPQRTLLQDISLIIVRFFFAQINLVFQFNLVLIR